MPLTGLQIYKLMPQTNCKECGFPTCLAFSMKLAAKQVELKLCPYVSEDSKAKLAAASAPPIRLIAVGGDGAKLEVGNETVMFRHEKTFYHRPGLFIRLKDTDPAIAARAAEADAYVVDYVGIKLGVDGFAVEAASGDGARFAAAIAAVRGASKKALILIAADPAVMAEGARAAEGSRPLLYAADSGNWQKMAEVAKAAKSALAVRGDTLDALASLTADIAKAGVEDLVLDPGVREAGPSLVTLTQIRRLALKKNFTALGYPVIAFPGQAKEVDEITLAAEQIAKYASFVILESFSPASVYPLLVLRQNIYTDPQKPIQVLPGLYEINSPKPDSPVMVTTNFSITYFAVNNEVEGSGWPAWLVVTDAEGMSVLTAWAAGKFDADRIGKAVKTTGVEGKVNHKRIIIPGQVAVLSGELEETLPGWQIMVGPKEAVDIPAYLKTMWKA
jgi:acetyl-CoA decarbonylase/synthase, CODH/ACS complex subunit gamma